MPSTVVGRGTTACAHHCHIHMIVAYTRGLHRACRRHYRLHRASKSSKELANISDITWQSGRSRRAREKRDANRKAAFKPPLGPLRGNCYRAYIDDGRSNRKLLGIVPVDSELYMAFQNTPQIKRAARFNPWSLVLELLDDPRLVFNEKRRNRLLNSVSQLGWINQQNVLAQRPLFAHHLLRNRCFEPDPEYLSALLRRAATADAEGEAKADMGCFVQLSPAQSISLHQIQWPRYIADKYEALASISANRKQRDSAEWDRIWLCTNACMEELRTAYVKNRAVFNQRMGVEEQLQRLIRGSFDHAPGLVLNAILSWNDDQYVVLNPYTKQRLLSIYFSNRETAKNVVVQAWQMYDWLIYGNPNFAAPANIDYKGKWDSRSLLRSLLFRSLSSFDNWGEATRSLKQLSYKWEGKTGQGPCAEQTTSDRKLVEKYFNIHRQLSLTR